LIAPGFACFGRDSGKLETRNQKPGKKPKTKV
jgi:hypothetical protein